MTKRANSSTRVLSDYGEGVPRKRVDFVRSLSRYQKRAVVGFLCVLCRDMGGLGWICAWHTSKRKACAGCGFHSEDRLLYICVISCSRLHVVRRLEARLGLSILPRNASARPTSDFRDRDDITYSLPYVHAYMLRICYVSRQL